MNECQGLNDQESSKKGVSSAQFLLGGPKYYLPSVYPACQVYILYCIDGINHKTSIVCRPCAIKSIVLWLCCDSTRYCIMKFISIIITYTGKYSWAILIWQGTKFLFFLQQSHLFCRMITMQQGLSNWKSWSKSWFSRSKYGNCTMHSGKHETRSVKLADNNGIWCTHCGQEEPKLMNSLFWC